MPFPFGLFPPRASRPSPRLSSPPVDLNASSSDDEQDENNDATPRTFSTSAFPARDGPYLAAASASSFERSSYYRRPPDFLLLHTPNDLNHASAASTATSTPVPSRSATPLPQFYSSATSSSCTSDADSEPTTPLFPRNRRNHPWTDDSRRWWSSTCDSRRRWRRRRRWCSSRVVKRLARSILRHPLFPTHPISILVTLLLITIFAILLTLLLIHILDPDKEPLPWRAYCAIPSTSTSPPSLMSSPYSPGYPFNSLTPSDVSTLSSMVPNTFPPPHLDDYAPAGLFLGVFSMDSSIERRMLIRSTWASHERSRNGAGVGDDGVGTSRTIVRFILGKPRSSWERRIQLEAETYNDIIILPIPENMNSGKTHTFFTWASAEAWVPPLPINHTFKYTANYTYSDVISDKRISPARHDPHSVRQEWHMTTQQIPWVRPDFVLKVDDDSFVMLAELEARLRVELYTKSSHKSRKGSLKVQGPGSWSLDKPAVPTKAIEDTFSAASTNKTAGPLSNVPQNYPISISDVEDPLVYWGYLVKNQFMAGELYGLSWSLTEWVANDPTVKGMTRGKEDKLVAKWMVLHPQASAVRWKSERCWIYDHPRAGTVYSHGFLFPSEVTRVRKSIHSYLGSAIDMLGDPVSPSTKVAAPMFTTVDGSSPSTWAYSSVSTFGVRYKLPLKNLTTLESIEALVEGSEMSKVREGGNIQLEDAWLHRERRNARYEHKRIGGTIVVHFIKKNNWYLETALALLEGDEWADQRAV